MSYKVAGLGIKPVSYYFADLEKAARAASKMEDQGVEDVRVVDPSGAEIPRSQWEAVWWQWAERNGSRS